MAKYLNLKMLRQSLGMNQTELSAEIGLAQGYISELEKGKKPITPEVTSKLKERFGVEVVEQWIQDAPAFQQTIEGDGTGFSGTGDVTVQSGESIPMEAFNKMLGEIAEQRKDYMAALERKDSQIYRLISLLEKR